MAHHPRLTKVERTIALSGRIGLILLQAPGDGISSKEHVLPANPQKGARFVAREPGLESPISEYCGWPYGLAHLH
jgi:hypothetical protein